jgi:hypothetical protein
MRHEGSTAVKKARFCSASRSPARGPLRGSRAEALQRRAWPRPNADDGGPPRGGALPCGLPSRLPHSPGARRRTRPGSRLTRAQRPPPAAPACWGSGDRAPTLTAADGLDSRRQNTIADEAACRRLENPLPQRHRAGRCRHPVTSRARASSRRAQSWTSTIRPAATQPVHARSRGFPRTPDPSRARARGIEDCHGPGHNRRLCVRDPTLPHGFQSSGPGRWAAIRG